MNDLNSCSFIGRLGRDVELRQTTSGDSVANFSIACGWKTKSKEGTEWVNVSVFGKIAEVCAQYLTKGSQVYVQGRLQTDKYTKDGVEKTSTKILADKVQFLGGKSDGAKPQQQTPAPQSVDELTDDIPF